MSSITLKDQKNECNSKVMKTTIALLSVLFFWGGLQAQHDDRISTIEFVRILDDNTAETDYYYRNNWKLLREKALEKGYIHSYELLETPFDETGPYHRILMTTYANEQQYEQREAHFEELIEEKGPLRLLNEKKPGEFRKRVMGKEGVRHWK